MIYVDVSAERAILAAQPSEVEQARDALGSAIVGLVMARSQLYNVDPRAAVDFDLMLITWLLRDGAKTRTA
jgi:hypothetical protein